MKSIILIAALFSLRSGFCVEDTRGIETVEKYQNEKEKVADAELHGRKVMSQLFDINLRIKNMTKKHNILNNKMISIVSDADAIATEIVHLEAQINTQKQKLSRIMRTIYMLGENSVPRLLFSSATAQELEQNLKYLNILSNQDYSLIKSYKKNLKLLVDKKTRMNTTVKKLAKIKNLLKDQENQFAIEQKSKTDILQSIEVKKISSLKKLADLRAEAEGFNAISLIDVSFYDQKGKLKAPIVNDVDKGFGYIENEKYHYKLSHKGYSYQLDKITPIQVIYDGRVSYVGNIDGYGNTVVVDHGDHYYSVYTRVDEVLVREGDPVKTNSIIAKSQSNLYFEIRHFSDAIDPSPWIFQKVTNI